MEAMTHNTKLTSSNTSLLNICKSLCLLPLLFCGIRSLTRTHVITSQPRQMNPRTRYALQTRITVILSNIIYLGSSDLPVDT